MPYNSKPISPAKKKSFDNISYLNAVKFGCAVCGCGEDDGSGGGGGGGGSAALDAVGGVLTTAFLFLSSRTFGGR